MHHPNLTGGRPAVASDPKLTNEEAAALRMLATSTLMKKTIPSEVREKLLDLKCVEQELGGLAVTAKGLDLLHKLSR